MSGEGSPERLAEHARLDQVGRILDLLARKGKIGPIFDRKELVNACVRSAERLNNLILVGKHGTGKNAVVEGIATRIARNKLPGFPWQTVVETNPSKLALGCMYVGNLENKLKLVFDNCASENAILFIDNLHLSIGAYSSTNDPFNDLLSIIHGLLPEPGDMCLVGSTTPEGYKMLHKARPEFVSRFVRIDVNETSPEDTLHMLHSVRGWYESKYDVKLEQEVLHEIVKQYGRFCHWRAFPGKAFEALGRLAGGDVGHLADGKKVISVAELGAMVRRETGLPDFILDNRIPLEKLSIQRHLGSRIFGQEEAVDEIAMAILRFKAQLNDPGGPVGSFMFVGPSGIGKTELAKVLAAYLFGDRDRLLVYPMSQYQGDQGRKRLLGDSGRSRIDLYETGKLLDDVRAAPFSVVLLDEVDQAGDETLAALYQILDEGRLVEGNGNEISFRSTIVILSTNVGMGRYFRKRIRLGEEDTNDAGGRITDEARRGVKDDLEDRFGVPFLNRLSTIIQFSPLSKETIRMVAEKSVRELQEQLPGLKSRGIEVEVSDGLIDLLVEKGYDERYGARPMNAAIRTFCTNPMAAFLSASPQGSKCMLRLDEDGGVAAVNVEAK